MSSTASESTPFPTRLLSDRSSRELTVVVDAFRASIDDITVATSSSQIRIRIERDGMTYDRTVSPPAHARMFTDDRTAVYHNGVLTVTVGTSRVSSVRR